MTAQFHDRFMLEGREYELVGVKGAGLFEPEQFGLLPVPSCTACWRGYLCCYVLQAERLVLDTLYLSLSNTPQPVRGPVLHGVAPVAPEGPYDFFDNLYTGLNLVLPFTGGLLLGEGFIRELYVHMGFQTAWKFATVYELLFEQGRKVAQRDVSAQMAELRRMNLQQRGMGLSKRDLEAWIESTFSLGYDL